MAIFFAIVLFCAVMESPNRPRMPASNVAHVAWALTVAALAMATLTLELGWPQL